MPQVEAGACGKPVLSIKAMALVETLVHGETAFLANIAMEVMMKETTVGEESGWEPGHRIVFKNPHTVDYRASVYDIADYLLALMQDEKLRRRMGEAGRKRVVENYDYRIVAKKFVQLISERLEVT
jgi:glycosyltransferase involved in cell wall biosynthesis